MGRRAGLCPGGFHCTCRKFSRAQSPCCGCSSALGKPSHSCQHNRMSCGAQNSRSINTRGHNFPILFFPLHFLWAIPSSIRQNPAQGHTGLGNPPVAFWELGAVMAWEAGLHNVPSAVTPFKAALILHAPAVCGAAEASRAGPGNRGFLLASQEPSLGAVMEGA